MKDRTLSCSKCCKDRDLIGSLALSGTEKQVKMIEKVISRTNMHEAYRQIWSNQGSAGADGMPVSKLMNHVNNNRNAIVTTVSNGSYLPQAILGVEIPKSTGNWRLL